MAKITVGKDGRLVVPALSAAGHMAAQEVVVLESLDDGLALHVARPDVQHAYIEVTTRCNLDCAMCVRNAWTDAPGQMDWETFQAAMRSLSELSNAAASSHGGGLQRITFGGYGEPLGHPRILDMVAQASALGVGVTVTTNGLLLSGAMSKALLAARVDTIIVSLDTMHTQAYRQTGLTGGADRVLSNLVALSELRREQHLMVPRIGLAFVVTRSNLDELAQLPKLAGTLGASFVLVSNLLPHTPDLAGEILYDRHEPLPALPLWPVRSGDYVLYGVARLPRVKWGAERRCRFVEERAVVIGWDGAVMPCYALMHSYPCYIYGRRKNVTRYVLGNVREQPLADVWMSEEYVRFRAKVRDFRFASCVDCGIACSFAENNDDCRGNTPSCADCLFAQDIIRCP